MSQKPSTLLFASLLSLTFHFPLPTNLRIVLELCSLNSCYGSNNGAGLLLTSIGSNTATLYAVSFEGNTGGGDIYNDGG